MVHRSDHCFRWWWNQKVKRLPNILRHYFRPLKWCGFSHVKRIPGDQEFEKFQVSSLSESLEKKRDVFGIRYALQSELGRDLLSHLGHVSFPFKWVSWVVGWLLWSITYMDGTRHFSKLLQSKIWRTKGNGNKTWHKHFLLLTRPHP